MTRRQVLQVGLGVAGAFAVPSFLAACGGNGGSSTDAATTSTTSTPIKKGGTLKFAIGDAQAKDSLDPALALTTVGTFGTSLIYDTLLAADVNWKLTPMLAEDYSISKDAKTHTFKIRKGVTFHTGKTLSSADVAAQFRRVLDKKTGSAGLSVLAPVLDPSGISTPDPSTIVFALKTPDAFFGQRVAHYTLRIPQTGTTDWSKGSYGTGPFMNKSFSAGEGFEFERNPNYWQDGVPYLDAVTGVSIPDPATKVQALLSGDVQLSDTVPSSAYSQLETSDTGTLLDLKNPSPFTFDVDGSVKPFSDVRVQHAMKMLLDREAMVKLIVGGRGVVSADTLIAPDDPWYPKDLKPFERDPEKAKKLLADAGYPNGFTEKAWTTTAYPYLNEGATVGKQNFADGGITLEIESVSNDRYLQAFLKEPIVMDYALRQHPVFMFQLYYMSSSSVNLSRLKDDKIDGWITELIQTVGEDKQAEIGGEIIRRYNDVSAELNPFNFNSYWGGSKKLQGWQPNPISNLDLRTAFLT